ncbi:MAG: hypothetical protein KME43_25325 [Myxacorys chilensis ATA2-1-KO14]|nr:hypothetical protein [Myxacorys chilensis ATA2-1-KO14]
MREEGVKRISTLEQEINQKKNEWKVQHKINEDFREELSQETKKRGLFEIYQKNKKQKQENNKLRTLEEEQLNLQSRLIEDRASVARSIVLNKREIEQLRYLAQKSYPQLEQTKKAADKAVKKAEAFLRTKLQERLTLVANKELQGLKAPDNEELPPWFSAWGITEVFASNYAVETTPRKRLARLLEEMPGGSIGITGPRGAGKSTLMRSFCGTSSPSELKERSIASTMLSAPVKYETRDFVLHIFSSICNLVLADYAHETNSINKSERTEANSEEDKFDRKPEEITSSLSSNLSRNINQLLGRRALLVVKLLGTILVISSFQLAYTSTFRLPQYDKAVPETAALNSPQPEPSPQNANERPLNVDSLQKTMPPDIALLKYFTALGITPSSAFLGGIILLILELLSLPSLAKDYLYRSKVYSYRSDDSELSSSKSRLIEEAKSYLKSIKFQQSYTSGWAGSLKLPILLDTSVNQATTLSKLQMTFPEIIHEYKKFVQSFLDITKGSLIIGIDELDKLDADKVQIFLNDIKALFGIENCFYLISVSEDAMSSFERRGIPFRDAFDSTFDTIIHIDYLTLDEARNLIDRRVLGLPRLMFYFIYCFSSGLARDLIRSCRSLLEEVDFDRPESFQKISAPELYEKAISRDIEAKLRSIYIEAKKVTVESSASDFLEATRQLEQLIMTGLSSKALLEVCQKLSYEPTMNNFNSSASLENLRIDLTAYLYYMATLFEIFVERSCSKILNGSTKSLAYLSNLTKARQFFTVNPKFACLLISDFRQTQRLEIDL